VPVIDGQLVAPERPRNEGLGAAIENLLRSLY
jgi:hypothetical protein